MGDSIPCAFCGRGFDFDRGHALYGRFAPGEKPAVVTPGPVRVALLGAEVAAVLIPDGTHPEGHDVAFVVCSQYCVIALRVAAAMEASDTGDDAWMARLADDFSAVTGLRVVRDVADGDPERLMAVIARFEAGLRQISPASAAYLNLPAEGEAFDSGDTAENRLRAETFVARVCAWCLEEVEAESLSRLGVQRKRHTPPASDTWTFLDVAGVPRPARILAADSPDRSDGEDGDVVFHVCPGDCQTSLESALEAERRGARRRH